MLHDAFQSLAFTILAYQELGWQMALKVWFALFCFFSLIIDFFFLSYFTTYLNDIPQTKETVCSHCRGWGHRWDGWMTLLTFLSDTDRTSIYLLIEDVEQMSCLLKRTAANGFLNGTFIWKCEKGNPMSAYEKRSHFDSRVKFWEESWELGVWMVNMKLQQQAISLA